jgi:N-acetyl-gamma-glutamyl-phosphate reductase common form
VRVAVVGAGGYAGGELLRLLVGHPNVTELVAVSRSQAGRPLADVHPALGGITDARFTGDTPADAARGRDVLFLSLEHGESSKVMDSVFDADPGLVVDLAADFRVQDPRLHERFYGRHAAPELVHRFVYGLADIEPERLRGARAIAAPGCFATAAQLALRPLAQIAPAARPSLFAVTGSSGAGVRPKETTHHPMRAHNLFAYGVGGHRHEAELLEQWRRWTGRLEGHARLMAHSGPFVRGIHLTLHAHLDAPLARGAAAAAFASVFAGRPFVRVLEAPPQLTHVVGTNNALVHASESEDGLEIQAMVVVDNLIKGAGGQAVQAMNIALGLAETAGLRGGGYFPC